MSEELERQMLELVKKAKFSIRIGNEFLRGLDFDEAYLFVDELLKAKVDLRFDIDMGIYVGGEKA